MRVIGAEGGQIGILPLSDAIRQAKEEGLDLVEVAATAEPPVCRIMDFSRYKYEIEKQERAAKKKQHVVHLKEIKLKPNIEEHDYQVKLQHLKKFLERGDKSKVTLMFRGREMAHMDLGRKVLERIVQDLAGVGHVEKNPLLEGRFLSMVMAPK